MTTLDLDQDPDAILEQLSDATADILRKERDAGRITLTFGQAVHGPGKRVLPTPQTDDGPESAAGQAILEDVAGQLSDLLIQLYDLPEEERSSIADQLDQRVAEKLGLVDPSP